MPQPVLDPEVIESLRELTPPGEPDVLKEVLQLFLDDVPTRIGRLRAAWQAADTAEVHRTAHSLKGSSGNIGATQLHDICRLLDEQGRAGDLSQMQALVASLEVEYARVEAEIKQFIA